MDWVHCMCCLNGMGALYILFECFGCIAHVVWIHCRCCLNGLGAF